MVSESKKIWMNDLKRIDLSVGAGLESVDKSYKE
jgi:hypothetical protein